LPRRVDSLHDHDIGRFAKTVAENGGDGGGGASRSGAGSRQRVPDLAKEVPDVAHAGIFEEGGRIR